MTIWPALPVKVTDFCTNLPIIGAPSKKKKKRRLDHPGEATPIPYTSRFKWHKEGAILCNVLYYPGQLADWRNYSHGKLFLTSPAINPFWEFSFVWISAELSQYTNDLKILNFLPDNWTGEWNFKNSYLSYLISIEDPDFEASQSLRKLFWNRLIGI